MELLSFQEGPLGENFAKSPTYKKIDFALKKSKKIDQTENIENVTHKFDLQKDMGKAWNPEEYSFLWGTWLWEQCTAEQKIFLNQLYWVAYYSQIISAEIATIYYNQLSAASLYSIDEFKIVCDTLDMESAQERTHIQAFKKVSEDFEAKFFGKRIFTFPMRTPFVKTMLYSDLGNIRSWLRKIQLQSYGLFLSNSPFIGCQYFTVRGLRTLNGKIVQHKLSKFVVSDSEIEQAPIPSKISYYHFLDESFHFNTSTTISHDLVNRLKEPSWFEKQIANLAISGCQKDHYNFSTAMKGIFWYEGAMFSDVYKVLQSPVFGMSKGEALEAMEKSLCVESDGAHASCDIQKESVASYKEYLSDFKYVSEHNKNMTLMSKNNLEKHLKSNVKSFAKFSKGVGL